MQQAQNQTPEQIQKAVSNIKTATKILQLDALRLFEVAVQSDADSRLINALADVCDDLDEENYPFNGFLIAGTETDEMLKQSTMDACDYLILSGKVRAWRDGNK